MIRRKLRLIGLAAIGLVAAYLLYIIADRQSLKFEVKNFEATEDQLNERNETNEAVSGMSDADKCKHIGGVFRDGTCK